MNDKCHLIINKECKLCSTLEDCLNYLTDNYKITTKFYGEIINKENIKEWIDWHSGLYTFDDEPYVDGKYLDVYIVGNSYEWAVEEFIDTIIDFDKENNIEYTGWVKEVV